MTVLTWKNVDAPDFSGTVESLRLASDMFGKAIGAAKGGLNDFEQGQTERANRAVMSDLMSYQSDPDRLTADLASGALAQKHGKNWGRMDPSTLSAIAKAPGDFLAFAGDKLKLGAAQRAEGDAQKLIAVRPLANEYFALNSKDPVAAQEFFNTNRDQFLGLNPNDLISIVKGGKGIEDDDVSSAVNYQNYKQDGTLFDRETLSYKEGRQATELLSQLRPETIDGESVDALFNTRGPELVKKYGATVVEATRRMLLGEYGGGTGASGGSGGGFVGGGTADAPAGAYDTVLGYGQYGRPPQPLSTMTIGDVIDFGRNVLIPNSKKAGIGRDSRGLLGSSAVGAFQFTQETLAELAPGVLGADWKSKAFTPEVQDALAEKLFNMKKGGNLKGTWAGLKDTRPGAYANVPWSEMKNIIIRDEGTAKNLGPAATATNVSLAGNESGNPASELLRTFAELRDDKSSSLVVATALTGKDGPFAGENRDAINRRIVQIVDKGRGRINARMAARLLEESAVSTDDYSDRFMENIGAGDGLKLKFNDRRIDAGVRLLSNPRAMASQAIKTEANRTAPAQISAAQAALAQAEAVLAGKLNTAARTNRRPNLAADYAAVAAATAKLESLIGNGAGIAVAGFPQATPVVRRAGAAPRVVPQAALPPRQRASANQFLQQYVTQPRPKLIR